MASERTVIPRNLGLLAAASTLMLGFQIDQRSAAATAATPYRAGDTVMVEAYDQSRTLTHGDASITFSLHLPEGATCPGDSANDNWRVQSFVIPAGEDPTKIKYGPIGPDPVGNGHYALFMVDTRPYVHQLTRRNPGPGQPGVISQLPPFNFAVVAGEHIPSGAYRIGVACTYFGATAYYWDTEIVITDSPGDKLSDLTWQLADMPAGAAEPPKSSDSKAGFIVVIAVAAGGLAVAAVLLTVWRRRTRPLTTLSKEP